MNEVYQSAGPCACMGPLGNDPYCPCVMRQKGLKPTDPWTPEKIAELHEALKNMFEWKVISKRIPTFKQPQAMGRRVRMTEKRRRRKMPP